MKNLYFVIVEHLLYNEAREPFEVVVFFFLFLSWLLSSLTFSLRTESMAAWDSVYAVVILFAIWYAKVCLQYYSVYVLRGLVWTSPPLHSYVLCNAWKSLNLPRPDEF